ncbi:KAP family P-loop NTPase fold protein [Jannaschia formosa]|uniref:KAP family P-loop NTPase fold protein n=1 Tax=Jannaschia formosa TaxID=2259592 RepID=UPI0010753E21|nr:P-loop NTPase fold protein [Jannaschia formosa]TFL16041.1 hypothetical protein DR046_22095 [Jannaschia formosa]
MIFGDNAIEKPELDRLDRTRAAKALCAVLDNPSVETPLTIGVLGGWGTGKTSLMLLLKHELRRDALARGGARDVSLWFDAWTYARQEHSLWRALLLNITAGLRKAEGLTTDPLPEPKKKLRDKLDELEDSLYRSQVLHEKGDPRVNWGAAPPLLADLALRVATAGLSDAATGGKGPFVRFKELVTGEDAREAVALIEREQRERYVAEVRSLDQFHRAFRDALALAGIGKDRRMILFVDDLDRCLPEDAVSAIEAIKLFLNQEGCVFVLGMDPDVVETGIGVRYRGGGTELPFEPSDYLDKVIQLPFRLPAPAAERIAGLVDDLAQQDPTGVIDDVRTIALAFIPPNPRSLKRALNVLLLAAQLEGSTAHDARKTRRERLAKLIVLQMFHRKAYRLATRFGPSWLKAIEDAAQKRGKLPDGADHLLADETLTKLLRSEPHFGAIDDSELTGLLGLTEIVRAGGHHDGD